MVNNFFMHSINQKYVYLIELKPKCFESQLINLTPFTQKKGELINCLTVFRSCAG